jgi:hypothetical protein
MQSLPAGADRDPSADLRGALTAPNINHRAAIIDPPGIGASLRAIGGGDGHYATKAALEILALTFVRPGEARHVVLDSWDMTRARIREMLRAR